MTGQRCRAVTSSQREVLERLARSRTAAHREVQRARALLLAGDGVANTGIAAQALPCLPT